jgi:hypothetical protein
MVRTEIKCTGIRRENGRKENFKDEEHNVLHDN